MSKSSEYIDEYIRRSLRINRVSAGEAARISKKLASANSRIKAKIIRLAENDFEYSMRLRIIGEISEILEKAFEESAKESQKVAEKIIEKEAEWQANIAKEYTDVEVSMPDLEAAIKTARETPYQGKTFKQWYAHTGATAPTKIRRIVEGGILEGNSISDIQAAVNGVLKTADANMRTLVRSQVLQSSALARKATVEANKHAFDEKIWNSTLDVRTTANICGVRDQKKYTSDNQPIGHNLPWGAGPGMIHFNCRSIEITLPKGMAVTGLRPSIGAGKEYKRGDSTTRTGRVRIPSKANKEKGIYKVKRVRASTDYEKWLRGQKKDFVADALGSIEKADAFKNGASLDDVAGVNLGTNLTIDQL